jgi:hypothetical protein
MESRITVLLAVVDVGLTVVPEVAFCTFHTVVVATLLDRLLYFVVPVRVLRRTIILLRQRTPFGSK